MRRFFLAFAILFVIGMSQNVISGTRIAGSVPADAADETVVRGVEGAMSIQAGLVVGGETPGAMPLMLMIAGLSGLTLAGGRSRSEAETARV